MLTTIMLLGMPILLPTFIAGMISPDLTDIMFDTTANLFAPFYMAIETIIDLLA